MPVFHYRALKQDGRVQRGQLTAAHENELGQFLATSGLELISARLAQAGHGLSFFQKISFGSSSNILRQKILFCTQLRDLLRSGFDVREALASAVSLLPQGAFYDAVLSIGRDIDQGARISSAFAAQGVFFDAVFLGLLKTGDATGDLATTFNDIAARLENEERFQKKLRKALRYPVFLMVVAFGAITFMMNFVVPEILVFLQTIATELPPSTRILVGISNLFSRFWLYGVGGGVVLGAGHSMARKMSETYASRTDRVFLALPVLGDVFRNFDLARFAGSLGSLLDSGLDVTQALAVATDTLNNRHLRFCSAKASKALQNGVPVSAAFSDLFPPLVTQMLKMGEKSGSITKKMLEASRMLEMEAGEKTDRLLSAIEPLLTTLIGAMLAWIVLAVLGPVYGSVQTLSATM